MTDFRTDRDLKIRHEPWIPARILCLQSTSQLARPETPSLKSYAQQAYHDASRLTTTVQNVT